MTEGNYCITCNYRLITSESSDFPIFENLLQFCPKHPNVSTHVLEGYKCPGCYGEIHHYRYNSEKMCMEPSTPKNENPCKFCIKNEELKEKIIKMGMVKVKISSLMSNTFKKDILDILEKDSIEIINQKVELNISKIDSSGWYITTDNDKFNLCMEHCDGCYEEVIEIEIE